MKKLAVFALLILFTSPGFAQVKIHSHNDYTHEQPLTEAYANRVYEIEADVFLIQDSLIVAHSKKDKNLTRTLGSMYLSPIAQLHKDKSTKYGFCLMIDIKDNWDLTYPALRKEIEKYGAIFDRSEHKNAIQIVISGNRPADSTFHSYPKWLFFDGLPNIRYAKKDLKRVTMISDNFATYCKWKGNGEIPTADKAKLKKIIDQAHLLNKPIRFWGAPDTKECWQQLHDLGVDIINTDKVSECKTYFEQHK
ncbi:phosphatidylinositol-specific phospholipase C/glycerophosphodiester phosphodiesterase family protein [Pedobacter boryungensis]|uniref:Glycerophosphodiester phosphodiesterase n=1 Tax=Pedobacter boryungensis TaxID=869962 RepID=A0ABX2DA41_9SPHI|nr:phosphatidylinositol-specific phospholipase C/glycerophosphodiester phosphodiesterase family protein [Pedobacter boryungensis]NQX30444.1 glycerophosphodiester phosphodiesterase [Pedobacter boryungensis]